MPKLDLLTKASVARAVSGREGARGGEIGGGNASDIGVARGTDRDAISDAFRDKRLVSHSNSACIWVVPSSLPMLSVTVTGLVVPFRLAPSPSASNI
jgi:hypothetical protein